MTWEGIPPRVKGFLFMNSFPKVLIIGETFHNRSGGGITLSNLFKNWPADNLAVIATSNISYSNYEKSKKYYRLGSDEYIVVWPLSIFIASKSVSGEVNISEFSNTLNKKTNSTKTNNRIINNIINLSTKTLDFIGLSNFIFKTKLSCKLLNWINEFNPDYIYFQNSNFQGIIFINEITTFTKIPVVVHPMDDFVKISTSPGLFYLYWKRRMQLEFKKLVDNASVRLSICSGMSDEYYKRYGYYFYAFHNPIDLNLWEPFTKKDWDFNGTFKILYTGRLGSDNQKALHILCKISDSFQKSGTKTEVHLFFSPLSDRSLIKKYKHYKTAKVCDYVENDHIPELISNYDLLFLPLGFSKKSIKATMFSMPTKTAEYLISGVPIIVYAPMQTALAKYAREEEWAYLVDNRKSEVLSNAIKNIYSNIDLRRSLGNKAIRTAIKNHDSIKVRNEFREMFK
jgi:glycosyltransferase involved in cell wall biosynthesis